MERNHTQLQTHTHTHTHTSRVKDSTTSDLDRMSPSSPMSRKELFMEERLSFCLKSGPPLDTGRLSRFAMSRFTDERSSSTKRGSMSAETNFGYLLSCRTDTQSQFIIDTRGLLQINMHFFNQQGDVLVS